MSEHHRVRLLSPIAAALGVLACLGSAAALGQTGQASEPAKNLVANPSFEQPTGAATVAAPWHGTAQVHSRDSQLSRTGKASLKYVNHDPERYVLCTQRIPVRAGWKCHASAWIKTQNIAGDESGATICLEWQDKDGKWLGGVYPAGVKGTRDWTRVEAITRLPDDAASCSVACYVRKGMTGTAWFDDVEVVRVADPPMQTVLLSPVYRGRITATGPKEARVRVRWNLVDYNLKPQDLQVRAVLSGRDKNVLQKVTGHPDGGQRGYLDLHVPVGGLEPGKYDLAVRLESPGGKELQVDHHRLARLSEGGSPKCLIDEHRRLLVDGKPLFPLGIYWSSITAEDIKVYSQSKFNCLMPYGSPTKEQMDLARKHGLKVIYSIKDWYAGSRWCPPSIRTAADEEARVRAPTTKSAAWRNSALPRGRPSRLATTSRSIACPPGRPALPHLMVLHIMRASRVPSNFRRPNHGPVPMRRVGPETSRLTAGGDADVGAGLGGSEGCPEGGVIVDLDRPLSRRGGGRRKQHPDQREPATVHGQSSLWVQCATRPDNFRDLPRTP